MIEKLKNLLEPEITKLGYILDNIKFESDTLEVVIDSNDGIVAEDCIKVTKAINPILDEEDLIKIAYVLDVCSKEKGSVEDGR